MLPYDIFAHIIELTDMQSIIHLYNTDKTIRKLCLNNKFAKVLLEFRTNPFF